MLNTTQDPFERFAFLQHYHNVITLSIQEGQNILTEAQNCLAPWVILAPYLWEQQRVLPDRVQPLLEVMQGSVTSIYVAASGAYREAISLLRPLVEMVLLEWQYEATATDDAKDRDKYRFLFTKYNFDRTARVPVIKHDKLFALEAVKHYQDFINDQSLDEADRGYLLRWVDVEEVRGLRHVFDAHLHAHPAGYNTVTANLSALPTFDLDQLAMWGQWFRMVHEAIALWLQFLYPNLMTWSQINAPHEFSWLKDHGDAQWMEVYWSDLLHPLQRKFFGVRANITESH